MVLHRLRAEPDALKLFARQKRRHVGDFRHAEIDVQKLGKFADRRDVGYAGHEQFEVFQPMQRADDGNILKLSAVRQHQHLQVCQRTQKVEIR